jgi:predicted phage baseplate assembly protein
MTVRFGDGITAARLPRGRNNVAATYRQGLGRAGTVRAGSLTTLLDRPAGLKAVINPSKARCGVDPESLEEARANAPNTVRTFGRIVSLRDFEDAAREFPGVSKAQATWTWDGEEQSVVLTVASADASDDCVGTKGDLREYLDRRRDINKRLMIQSVKKIPIEIKACIWKEKDRLPEDVEKAAKRALEDYFKGLNLGESIHISEIYNAIQSADGVMAVDVDLFGYKDESDRISHGSDMEPALTRVPIIGTHPDLLMIRPAELAELSWIAPSWK